MSNLVTFLEYINFIPFSTILHCALAQKARKGSRGHNMT